MRSRGSITRLLGLDLLSRGVGGTPGHAPALMTQEPEIGRAFTVSIGNPSPFGKLGSVETYGIMRLSSNQNPD